MNSIIEIIIYGKRDADDQVKKIISSECDKFWVVPGSESLPVSFDIDERTRWSLPVRECLTPIAYCMSECTWSLNPGLSKCSAVYVARALAAKLGNDFLVIMTIDGNELNFDLSVLQMSLIEFVALLTTPITLLCRLKVIAGIPVCFLVKLLHADWQRRYQEGLGRVFEKLNFKPAARLPKQLTWAVKGQTPYYILDDEKCRNSNHASDVRYRRVAVDLQQWFYRHSFGFCNMHSLPCYTLIESDQLRNVPDFTLLVTQDERRETTHLSGFQRIGKQGRHYFDKRAAFLKCDDESFSPQRVLSILQSCSGMTITKRGYVAVFNYHKSHEITPDGIDWIVTVAVEIVNALTEHDFTPTRPAFEIPENVILHPAERARFAEQLRNSRRSRGA